MTNKCPLISCVCVTHNRPNMLERVIKCFEYQTYNNKQLVIVYEELDKLTKAYIDSHTFSNNELPKEINEEVIECLKC